MPIGIAFYPLRIGATIVAITPPTIPSRASHVITLINFLFNFVPPLTIDIIISCIILDVN